MKIASVRWVLLLLVVLSLRELTCLADPFKLGVEERGYYNSPQNGYSDYPAPHMIPLQGRAGNGLPLTGGTARVGPIQGKAVSAGAFSGRATQQAPLHLGVQQIALPAQFLGVWKVHSHRIKVDSRPELKARVERAYDQDIDDTFEIAGNPASGYSIGSSTGVRTQLIVDKVQGNTAFIRYQHPVINTVAQEAYVLTLNPGGMVFNGLSRTTISKPGEPGPRFRITWQMVGQRQR